MPKGPRGEKRPADVIGNAVKVMRIATREEPDDRDESAASAAAQLGKLGGAARAQSDAAETCGNSTKCRSRPIQQN